MLSVFIKLFNCVSRYVFLHYLLIYLFRFKIVDYLTTTGIFEFIFIGRVTEETPAFKSLWLPFDNAAWASILVSAVAAAVMLCVIERCWSQLSGNEETLLCQSSEGKLLNMSEGNNIIYLLIYSSHIY